jgi:hypothetical protein
MSSRVCQRTSLCLSAIECQIIIAKFGHELRSRCRALIRRHLAGNLEVCIKTLRLGEEKVLQFISIITIDHKHSQ